MLNPRCIQKNKIVSFIITHTLSCFSSLQNMCEYLITHSLTKWKNIIQVYMYVYVISIYCQYISIRIQLCSGLDPTPEQFAEYNLNWVKDKKTKATSNTVNRQLLHGNGRLVDMLQRSRKIWQTLSKWCFWFFFFFFNKIIYFLYIYAKIATLKIRLDRV